jgi:hypothetical protein
MRLRQGLFVILALVLFTRCAGSSAAFSDDFSDPASGWSVASTEAYQYGYDRGQYLIRLDDAERYVWTTAGRAYDDVTIEVVVQSEGATDNHFGVLCRASGAEFYYFAISADGYYAIFRHTEADGLLPLTGPAMLRSPLIHRDSGSGTNRLLAVCEDTTLAFYINGERVAQIEVEEDGLEKGDVGLAAGMVRGESTVVWFDDLDVVEP